MSYTHIILQYSQNLHNKSITSLDVGFLKTQSPPDIHSLHHLFTVYLWLELEPMTPPAWADGKEFWQHPVYNLKACLEQSKVDNDRWYNYIYIYIWSIWSWNNIIIWNFYCTLGRLDVDSKPPERNGTWLDLDTFGLCKLHWHVTHRHTHTNQIHINMYIYMRTIHRIIYVLWRCLYIVSIRIPSSTVTMVTSSPPLQPLRAQQHVQSCSARCRWSRHSVHWLMPGFHESCCYALFRSIAAHHII